MMVRNGLNTLEYVQRLERAGVPREQAEVQASIFYEIINSELATRRDIEEVKAELKRDMAELKRDMAEMKKDLKIWLGGFAVAGFGMLVALSKLGLLQAG